VAIGRLAEAPQEPTEAGAFPEKSLSTCRYAHGSHPFAARRISIHATRPPPGVPDQALRVHDGAVKAADTIAMIIEQQIKMQFLI
jgi:hypothetical protein